MTWHLVLHKLHSILNNNLYLCPHFSFSLAMACGPLPAVATWCTPVRIRWAEVSNERRSTSTVCFAWLLCGCSLLCCLGNQRLSVYARLLEKGSCGNEGNQSIRKVECQWQMILAFCFIAENRRKFHLSLLFCLVIRDW